MDDFLIATESQMKDRKLEQVDFVFVSGDGYVDHPSFAAALLGRLLEQNGYSVAILAQPDWKNPENFKIFGKPKLAFLVSAGAMDSMVSNYTANNKPRSCDVYAHGGVKGHRPDRATQTYTGAIRQAYKGVNVIIGGIEASLRRMSHYDYWSNTVKKSILLDSKADLLIYGMGENALLEIASQLKSGKSAREIRDVRGTCWYTGKKEEIEEFVKSFENQPETKRPVFLPSYEQIKADNEARQEWNRAVDEARASGIPEEDIVSMKKELVSSEIKESIKVNGFMPELLGKILKKAVETLKSRIKSFKLPEKKIPVFDFENYNKMVKVNKKLQKIIADIKVIDSKVEHKLQKSNECQGIKYRKFKITLLKEIGELNVQRGEKTSELSQIVRGAGYKDVNQFMKAFEKSCRLLEEYQKASEDKTQDDPKEKESVLSKLKAYEEEAKHRPSKSKSKHKDSQEL